MAGMEAVLNRCILSGVEPLTNLYDRRGEANEDRTTRNSEALPLEKILTALGSFSLITGHILNTKYLKR